MTNYNLGRWLIVALALVGLALVAPMVSAHGNETTADDARPGAGLAGHWGGWMDGHMGAGSIEWMESHMGITIEEMAENRGSHGRRGSGRGC
ncbi:hypothetical protein [Haladaptatus sp. NG-SE-30]